MFDPSFLIKGLNRFSVQSTIQSISAEWYKNGDNSLYFSIPNIDPFTVKWDIYLGQDNLQVDFTITVTLGKDNGDRPTNLPNAQLVSYFVGLTSIVGGAYAADTANEVTLTKEVLESIGAIAAIVKGAKEFCGSLIDILEWVISKDPGIA